MRTRDFRPGRAVPLLNFLGCAVLAASVAASTSAAAQAPQPTPQASPRPSPTSPAPTPPATKPAVPVEKDGLPSARSIIDRHIQAVGGRKAILAHTSTRAVGTVSIPANGLTGTLEAIGAKPNRSLLRITISGIGEIVEGFDGTIGWGKSPVVGAMLSVGKELEQKRFDADYYGDLRETSRYASMTTVTKTLFDGRDCYKVSLVRKDGGEDFDFYDPQTGLKAGSMGTRESPMGAITVTQVQGDYKKFGDLLQPTVMKQTAMGVQQVFTFTTIEYDKVTPSVFDLPADIKALVK